MPIIALGNPKARTKPSQCQHPSGPFGRFVLWTMNRRHSRVTDWGLQQISIGDRDAILDVGCGGGRTVAKLAAAAPHGTVHGIDHAEASVAVARRGNQAFIEQGRVAIEQASVSSLPFSDDTFDLVTAVETHFWWPDLPAGLREIFRVLRPGGRLMIIAEFYHGGRHAKYADKLSRYTTMAALTVDEHRTACVEAGFSNPKIDEDASRGWLCVVATKP